MQLVNFMEGAVQRVLEELLQDPAYRSVQLTEKAKLDVLAYALNHLPAKYVVTEKGHLFTRTEELKQQFHTDIVVELSKAVRHVQANPR